MHTDRPVAGRTAGLIAVALLAVSGCAPRYIAAPERPPKVAPKPANAPLPVRDGEGQLTLGTTPGAARVALVIERRRGASGDELLGGATYSGAHGMHNGTHLGINSPLTVTRPLCQTPCVVNLPLGAHELLFSGLDPGSARMSSAIVQVGLEPGLVQHAMGTRRTYIGRQLVGIMGIAMGTVSMALGGAMLGIGETADGTDLTTRGAVIGGLGAGVLLGAVLALVTGSTEIQPGSTVQWTPAP